MGSRNEGRSFAAVIKRVARDGSRQQGRDRTSSAYRLGLREPVNNSKAKVRTRTCEDR